MIDPRSGIPEGLIRDSALYCGQRLEIKRLAQQKAELEHLNLRYQQAIKRFKAEAESIQEGSW